MEKHSLPEGWEWHPLSKFVASLENGRRPRGGVSKYTSGIPSISAEQISDNGKFRWDSIRYVPYDFYIKSKKGIIKENDILIVKDGATTGKCAFVDSKFPYEQAMVNEHTFILRTGEELAPKFAFYFLKSPLGQHYFYAPRERGVIGSLSSNFSEEIEIPVPPKPEQLRIVNLIDTLLRGIQESQHTLEQSISEANVFFKATLEKLFTKWPISNFNLEDYLSGKPRNGWSPPAKSLSSEGVPVLTLSAVTGFRYNGTQIKRTNAKTDPAAQYWLKPNELLITRSNTPDLVGHAAIYDGNPYPCICPDLIMKMTVDSNKAEVRFVYYWMQTTAVRRYIFTRSRGTSGSMKKISQRDVKGIPMPEIDIEEQKRIVDYLDKLKTKVDELKRLQTEIETDLATFTPALLAKAFRGEL